MLRCIWLFFQSGLRCEKCRVRRARVGFQEVHGAKKKNEPNEQKSDRSEKGGGNCYFSFRLGVQKVVFFMEKALAFFDYI